MMSSRPSSEQNRSIHFAHGRGGALAKKKAGAKGLRLASGFPPGRLARMNLLWYIVLDKVQDDERPAAAKNPADFLPNGGG